MSDYWYENSCLLQPGDVVKLESGEYALLSHRVPGDGTDWYVQRWIKKLSGGYWSDEEFTIHTSEISKGPPDYFRKPLTD